MSVHYSKCQLNTYSGTPYFAAHCPADYPIGLICQKVQRFRALPPNVQQLAARAKAWATRQRPGAVRDAEGLYDEAGYELDPATGQRLTDEEVAAMWAGSEPPDVEVRDIPVPAGGFPDPATWEPPTEADDDDDDDSTGPTEAQLLSDIAGHGRAHVARDYGVSSEQLVGVGSDRELAQLILQKRG